MVDAYQLDTHLFFKIATALYTVKRRSYLEVDSSYMRLITLRSPGMMKHVEFMIAYRESI